jgi:DNA-binding protein HU-beta
MNKGEFIQRLSARLGDQKTSTVALDALVTEIENAVSSGDKVNISGFGVFEKRDRAARTSRNPRTGEPIQVKQTSVPVFRPGQTFKTLVAGEGKGGQGTSRTSGRAQTSRTQAAKAQPAKGQSSRAQPARAQASRAQSARGQSSYAQGGRAQSSYARSARGQSSYAQGGRAQSGFARQGATSRQGATAKGQTSRARSK